MRGQILGVDRRTGDGLVAGSDGRRYAFRPNDWGPQGEPAIGLEVDFEAEDGRARSLFPVPVARAASLPVAAAHTTPAMRTDRNKLLAALLAFFLGPLGVHRFYLGRNGSGIAMLILTLTMVGVLISGPWALIDFVRYLVMSDEEFEVRYRRR